MKNKNLIFYLIIVILTVILIVMGYMIKDREQFKNRDTDNNFEEKIVEENNSNDVELNDEDMLQDINVTTNEISDASDDGIILEQQTELEVEQSSNIITELPSQDAVGSDGLKLNPNVGDRYANLIISKIGVNAPIFFGDSNEIILNGVGHSMASYFPGEGGSVIMCEHNYLNNFNRLQELEKGDIIEIKTGYGDFNYIVVDKQIVHETETYKLPITKEKEQLMIYTCHEMPEELGQTQYRMVVYADKI